MVKGFNLNMLFLIAGLSLLLPGCARQPIYVTEPLPLPVRPLLPSVYAHELDCISNDTYQRLVTRELKRRQYAETLETIIQSTHKEAGHGK